jgi:5-carboxymethyl-2-hydroxymuconate isomerase
MPHAIIEHSGNVTGNFCTPVHQAMVASGLFDSNAIKTRSYSTNHFFVGNKMETGSFIHVTASVLEGRTVEQRKALSASLIDTLKSHFPEVDQITIDIREMNRETYGKHVRVS